MSAVFAKISHPEPQVAKVNVDFDKTTVGELEKLGLDALKLGSKGEDYKLHSIVAYQQDVINISSLGSSDTLSKAKIPTKCCLYFNCTRIQAVHTGRPMVLGGEEETEEKGRGEASGSDLKMPSLKPENAFQQLGSLKGAQRKAALEFIDKNAKKVLETKDFLDQSEDLLVELIKRETFGIKESKLLEHLVAWSKHKSGRTLTKFKPHIRFGLFSVKDVASQVVPLGILSQSESLALFTYVSQTQAGRKDAKLAGFPDVAVEKRSTALGELVWYMKTPMSGVIAEEDGTFLISQPFRGDNTTVRTEQGFSKELGGIHTYEMEIVDMSSNTSFRCGLVTGDYTQWQEGGWAIGNRTDGTSCGFYSGTMNTGGLGTTSGSAPSFNSRTTIILQFDTEKMIWRYGTPMEKRWSGYFTITRNQDQTFYPAVTFYDSGHRTSVRIRSVENPDWTG